MTPLCCQKVRNHQGLPLAFWFWDWPTVFTIPIGLPLVVLKKDQFIVCDKDKGMRNGCTRKGISVIIPKLELRFIFHPLINKCTSIFNNIVSLMPINIHAVLWFSIAPLHFCKPSLCWENIPCKSSATTMLQMSWALMKPAFAFDLSDNNSWIFFKTSVSSRTVHLVYL